MLKKILFTLASGSVLAAATVGCSSSQQATAKSEGAKVSRAIEMARANADDRAGYYSRYNAFMRTCLKQGGFQWFDYVPPEQDERRIPGMDDATFVKTYGFGVSTLLDNHPRTAAPMTDNPNLAYRTSLSKKEQTRYRNVQRGCDQSSWGTIGQSPEKLLQLPPEQAKLLDKADARSATDPRLADAKKNYAACLTKHGYHASTGEELSAIIDGKVAPFRAKYEAAVKSNGNTLLKIADALTPEDLAQLRDIQRMELDMAAVDHECGELLYPVAQQVQKEWTDKALNGQL